MMATVTFNHIKQRIECDETYCIQILENVFNYWYEMAYNDIAQTSRYLKDLQFYEQQCRTDIEELCNSQYSYFRVYVDKNKEIKNLHIKINQLTMALTNQSNLYRDVMLDSENKITMLKQCINQEKTKNINLEELVKNIKAGPMSLPKKADKYKTVNFTEKLKNNTLGRCKSKILEVRVQQG